MSKPLTVELRVNELGGLPTSPALLKQMGLTTRGLSGFKVGEDELMRRIEGLASSLGLPQVVLAEALHIGQSMSGQSLGRIEGRAAYCIYIAGKRNSCVKADITLLCKQLSVGNPAMTKGKLGAMMWKIHKAAGKESIGPSNPLLHLEFIFRSLASLHPEFLKGLAIAYDKAKTLAREAEPSSSPPRQRAARFALEGLREVDWKTIGLTPLGATQLIEICGFEVH